MRTVEGRPNGCCEVGFENSKGTELPATSKCEDKKKNDKK
jgi:hypothetical protein